MAAETARRSHVNKYEQGLDKNAANFAALTPLNFIERAASVYPDQASIIHGATRYTWSQTYARACLLASALGKLGIGEGDTVAFMGANTPETFEAHFGVPRQAPCSMRLTFG
jgi:fatty-acyl-CoA synthase